MVSVCTPMVVLRVVIAIGVVCTAVVVVEVSSEGGLYTRGGGGGLRLYIHGGGECGGLQGGGLYTCGGSGGLQGGGLYTCGGSGGLQWGWSVHLWW